MIERRAFTHASSPRGTCVYDMGASLPRRGARDWPAVASHTTTARTVYNGTFVAMSDKKKMDKETTQRLEVRRPTWALSALCVPFHVDLIAVDLRNQEFHKAAAAVADDVVYSIFPNKVRICRYFSLSIPAQPPSDIVNYRRLYELFDNHR